MTRTEKEQFSAHMAALFAPPDAALLAELQRRGVPHTGDEEFGVAGLQREYRRLFANEAGEKISLVESTYKPWTSDPSCPLGFSREKGLLLGDCALHMQKIFQVLNVKIPPDFRGTPDHLVLELELLSYLYRFAPEEQVRGFIEDHLDWVSNLRGEIQKRESGFYGRAVERLLDFLTREIRSAEESSYES